MKLTMKSSQVVNKKTVISCFSAALFTACSVFVAIRGHDCFEKFLDKPEAVDISFKFTNGEKFPSITICTKKENTYNEEVFDECQLRQNDYIINGAWMSSKNSNCSDPKKLYKRVIKNLQSLEMKSMEISTFTKRHKFNQNEIEDALEWSTVPYNGKQICFSMTIPDLILKEGISKIKFEAKPFHKVMLHQKGLFRANMPGASPAVWYNEVLRISVTHEILHLLHYDGYPCIQDENYRMDECRQNYIYEVKIEKR